MTEGSELWHKYIASDETHDGISRKVWGFNPWVISLYSGSERDGRRDAMYRDARARYGDPTQPFGDTPRPGHWREGNATVFGWTWWGFDTRERMEEFAAAWPAPKGVA